jgi:hypothetical protein
MTLRSTFSSLLISALLALSVGCNSGSSASDACLHENCVVPLADIMGACAPTLQQAMTNCPYTKVETGPCGALTFVKVTTINPIDECYYETATGALKGGIARSDAGFTKIAGDVPAETCTATTLACDHTGQ